MTNETIKNIVCSIFGDEDVIVTEKVIAVFRNRPTPIISIEYTGTDKNKLFVDYKFNGNYMFHYTPEGQTNVFSEYVNVNNEDSFKNVLKKFKELYLLEVNSIGCKSFFDNDEE